MRAAEHRVRGERVAPRARMVVLLMTGAAPTLASCAALLGFSPRGVARWWATYRQGGRIALLAERPRRGRQPRLPASARAGLEAVMATGAIATRNDAQRYLAEERDIVYPSRDGVWHQLHKHRIKRKTGRRRHQRADAAAQAAVKAGFRAAPGRDQEGPGLGRRRSPLWPAHRPAAAVVSLRRRWCPCGVRPPWLVADQSEWLWLYTAVEPATGRACFLYVPGVTKEWVARFLTELSKEVGDQAVAVVLDNASSHRAKIPWPAPLTPPLPSSSPELNPAEQVFRGRRAKRANRIFATLDELAGALTEQLQEQLHVFGASRRFSTNSPPIPGGPRASLPQCQVLRERV